MRVTERGVQLVLIGLVAGAGLVFALVGGSVAGFVYPGDFLVWTVALTACGVIVLRARPSHAIGRLFLWAALAAALNYLVLQVGETFMADYTFEFSTMSYPPGTPTWFKVFDGVFGLGYAIANLLVVAAFARFPEGTWISRWVGWLFWLSAPLVLVSNLGLAPGVGVLPVLVMAGVITRRSLQADAVYRRQVAWALIGYGSYLVIGISSVILPEGVPPDWITQTSIVLFPAGMVLAITRYKLFELDRIASRTVTYLVVVGVLAAAYFGLVLVLRSLLPVEGPLPVALSTLAVAFAFFPLARRVQSWVDRRFFRSPYDAASVVASFASELRGTIDADAVVDRAESVVGEVFAPESVGVWLAEEPS